jgi:hypothetical protein
MRKVDDPLRKLVEAWHSGTLRPQREGNALRTSHLCARKLRIAANPQKCGDGPGQSVRSIRVQSHDTFSPAAEGDRGAPVLMSINGAESARDFGLHSRAIRCASAF